MKIEHKTTTLNRAGDVVQVFKLGRGYAGGGLNLLGDVQIERAVGGDAGAAGEQRVPL